jgi:UTP-glucose-1-phosphate uridylyltransferase
MKATLVIMAAGLGSRYGGEKQVDGIGPSGEAIMEYSVYDAVKAGFHKVVFIIKPHMLDTVKQLCGDRLSRMTAKDGTPIELAYVFQDFSSIPNFYSIPQERVKPFGTVHAALCAKDVVNEPFALINADDYYGVHAYEAILAELEKMEKHGEATMVGYQLKNTVSDYGTVTRGVCIQENGNLRELKETYKIKKYADGRICDTENPKNEILLDPNTLVSMNFWGFTPWIFEKMEEYFHAFLRELSPDELKAECLLPSLVDLLIRKGELRVPVLSSDAVWFGVTYQEDREVVADSLRKLHESGSYPPSLRSN